MAKCLIQRDSNNKIIKITDSEGKNLDPTFKEAMEFLEDTSKAAYIWATTQTIDFRNTFGETVPSLETIFEYLRNTIEPRKMTSVEKLEVSKMMRGVDQSEFTLGLNKIFPEGVFDEKMLMKSDLFTLEEKSYISKDTTTQTNLFELSNQLNKTTETIESWPEPSEVVFDIPNGERNKYGVEGRVNPNDVTQSIAETVVGIREREAFDEAFLSVPYEPVVTEYFNNKDFADRMYERFSNLDYVPVQKVSAEGVLIPKNQINKVETLENTLDLDSVDFKGDIEVLESIPEDIWNQNIEEVEQGLESIRKSAIEAGLDLEGLEDLSHRRPEVLRLLRSLRNLQLAQNTQNFENFKNNYRDIFEIGDTQVINIEKSREGINIRVENPKSSTEMFSENSMIEVAPNLYKVVPEKSSEQLYEEVYQKTVEEDNTQREGVIDENGFYSGLEMAIFESNSNRWGSADQFLGEIRKLQGYNQQEVEWTGLEQWARNKKKFSKEEVIEYLNQNRVRIQEVVRDQETGHTIEYSDMQLEGYSSGYKEVLLLLPGEEILYSSQHYNNVENLISHIRMNNRTDSEGRKVLHVEEIQSDWGQDGRRDGFYDSGRVMELESAISRVESDLQTGKIDSRTASTQLSKLIREKTRIEQSHKKGPFVEKTDEWVKLSTKVAIQHAVREGAERITWTMGEAQSNRYGLNKEVKEIRVEKEVEDVEYLYVDIEYTDGDVLSLNLEDGVVTPESRDHKGKRIKDILNEDIQTKIEQGGDQTIPGEGLTIGGEGMSYFYGSKSTGAPGIVGKNFSDAVRDITGKKIGRFSISKINGKEHYAVEITPEIVEAVNKGIPLYQRGNIDVNEFTRMKTGVSHRSIPEGALPKDISNREASIRHLENFINREVTNVEVGRGEYNYEVLENMILHKLNEGVPLQIKKESNVKDNFKVIEEVNVDSEYLSSDYLHEFQKNKLRERENNSEKYDKVYSKIEVGEEGLKITRVDDMSLAELKSNINDLLSAKEIETLRSFTYISRDPVVRNLFTEQVIGDSMGQTRYSQRTYYQNNIESLPTYKGDFEYISDNIITAPQAKADFIKVEGKLFEHVNSFNGQGFFIELNTFNENMYVVPQRETFNNISYDDIKSYIRSNNQRTVNTDIYSQNELNKINQKNFDC